jgi:type III secretory pathway component EscU
MALREVEEGGEIPESTFEAVAALLARYLEKPSLSRPVTLR